MRPNRAHVPGDVAPTIGQVMKTRWLIGAATLIIVTVCLILWMPFTPPPTPGVANKSKITPRMTMSEVEALLGPPDFRMPRGGLSNPRHFWKDGDEILGIEFGF